MGMLLLIWHYGVCAIILLLCWAAREKDKIRWCVCCDIAMLVVSVIGFLSAYPAFAESGKTFAMYVQRYGFYSLGVFVFPMIGFLMTLGCSGDQL